jgi:putative membrane protein
VSTPWRREDRLPLALLLVVGVALAWSAWQPSDRATWWLETVPVLVVVPLLVATRRRFPWTPLAYVLGAAHCLILVVGGHYTYAEVPLGHWVKDALELSRNHYDRLGHLAQGFVPAIAVRELAVRTSPLRGGAWLVVLTTSACLAFSAFYELVEWWVALLSAEAAESFLGTQGDHWDTQWDMFLALVGALAAQVLLAGRHDRQIARLTRGDEAAAASQARSSGRSA